MSEKRARRLLSTRTLGQITPFLNKLIFTFENALDLMAHLNERIVTENIFRKCWKKFSEVTGKKWKFSESSEKYFPKVRKNIFRKFGKVDDIPFSSIVYTKELRHLAGICMVMATLIQKNCGRIVLISLGQIFDPNKCPK